MPGFATVSDVPCAKPKYETGHVLSSSAWCGRPTKRESAQAEAEEEEVEEEDHVLGHASMPPSMGFRSFSRYSLQQHAEQTKTPSSGGIPANASLKGTLGLVV